MSAVPRPPVPILMYHEIAGPTETDSQLAVPPSAFASQLGYLHDAGFQTLTAGTVAEIMNGGGGQLPDRAVVLTFDDGFEDFHRQALPLLDRYGFTATLYVTTGWVEDAGPLPAGRRPAGCCAGTRWPKRPGPASRLARTAGCIRSWTSCPDGSSGRNSG